MTGRFWSSNAATWPSIRRSGTLTAPGRWSSSYSEEGSTSTSWAPRSRSLRTSWRSISTGTGQTYQRVRHRDAHRSPTRSSPPRRCGPSRVAQQLDAALCALDEALRAQRHPERPAGAGGGRPGPGRSKPGGTPRSAPEELLDDRSHDVRDDVVHLAL